MVAMDLLRAKGIVIRQISVTEALARKMIDCRRNMDNCGPTKGLWKLDTEFDVFLESDKVNPEYLASKPDNFIGLMFNIDVLKEDMVIDKKQTAIRFQEYASWWDHLKSCYLPRWLLNYFPIKYVTDSTAIRFTQSNTKE